MQSIIPGESLGEEGAGDGCSWTSFDTPAYVRRGLAVEEMWLSLQGKLQHTWTEWSGPMGMLCSQLRHQADGLEKFRPWLGSDEDLARLLELDRRLNFRLKYPPGKSLWLWPLKGSLKRLRQMGLHLNEAWAKHLATLDLGPLNRARELYNRWYILEKECAMRSARLAAGGFEMLPMATVKDLEQQHAALPIFEMR
jgi:hypothetical protein